MLIAERGYSSDTVGYRFGFNGYENEPDVAGAGSVIDFGARVYDSRLGRFFSVDPMSHMNHDESGYIMSGNSPILYSDEAGEYKKVKTTSYYKDKNGDLQVKRWCDVFKKTEKIQIDIEIHNQKAYVLGHRNFYTGDLIFSEAQLEHSASMMEEELIKTLEQQTESEFGKSPYVVEVSVAFVNDDGSAGIKYVESLDEVNTKGKHKDDLIVVASGDIISSTRPLAGRIYGLDASAYNSNGLLVIKPGNAYLDLNQTSLLDNRTLSHEFYHNVSYTHHSNERNLMYKHSGSELTLEQQVELKNLPTSRNYRTSLKRVVKAQDAKDERRIQYEEDTNDDSED